MITNSGTSRNLIVRVKGMATNVRLTSVTDIRNYKITCTYYINLSSDNLAHSILETDKHSDMLFLYLFWSDNERC